MDRRGRAGSRHTPALALALDRSSRCSAGARSMTAGPTSEEGRGLAVLELTQRYPPGNRAGSSGM